MHTLTTPHFLVPGDEPLIMVFPGTGSATWQVVQGHQDIQVMSMTANSFHFRAISEGQVVITVEYDTCFGYCFMTIPFCIGWCDDSVPWFDNDSDGLPDSWEYMMGLNPYDADSDGDGIEDWQEDTDGDGMINHDEWIYSTNAIDPDTDHDGVWDWQEVQQGSDPNDAGDGGAPPDPQDIVEVELQVGDHSDSHSEWWLLRVGHIRFKAPGYGQVTELRPFKFARGKSYPITLEHLDTILPEGPNYDYTARVEVPDETSSSTCIVIHDPQELLPPDGTVDNDDAPPNYNFAAGKQATLHLIHLDLDIDSDNDNGFAPPSRSDDEDEIEDVQGDPSIPGKVALVNSLDFDFDGLPDFADGFDHLGEAVAADDLAAETTFTPVILEISGINPDVSTVVTLNYAASDPAEISATLQEPFVLPQGSARLWTKDGSASRNPASVHDGGDFLSPGEYVLDDLGIDPSGGSVTLYLETVRESQAVADIFVSVQATFNGIAACEPDRVRITAPRVELLGRNLDEPSLHPVAGLVGTAVDDPALPPTPPGFTPGAYQTYLLKVYDPRPALTSVTLGTESLALSSGASGYSTPEFVCLAPNPPPGATLPPYPAVMIGAAATQGSYNPWWWFSSKPNLDNPAERDEFIGKFVVDSIDEMESQGWTGPPPPNTNAFGIEVHARVAAKIAADNDGRWLTNVYVARANHPTLPFRTIMSIGSPPPGGLAGTTEIDVLRLRQGYNPQVGDILDPNQIDDIYEVKTSAGGKIDPDQKARLKQVRDGKIKITMAYRKWTHGLGWHKTPRVTRIIKIIGLAGLVTSAYAVINLDDFDDEVDEIIMALNVANAENDPLQRKVACMAVVSDIQQYLNHFDPSDSVNIVTLGTIYYMLGQDDW
jgi:hypothetical protein